MLKKLKEKILEALPQEELQPKHITIDGKNETPSDLLKYIHEWSYRNGKNDTLSQCRQAIERVFEKAEVDKAKIEMIFSNYVVYGSGVNERTELAEAIANSKDLIKLDD